MTVGLSPANLADQWLNWIRGIATTAPSLIATKLHTGDPGASGATAGAVGDTTRKTITLSAPSGTTPRAIALSGTQPVWTNGVGLEVLTHVSNWDSTSAGNFLWSAALAAPTTWGSTNTFTLTTLGVTIAPIAA